MSRPEPNRYGESVVREILGAQFVEELPAPVIEAEPIADPIADPSPPDDSAPEPDDAPPPDLERDGF